MAYFGESKINMLFGKPEGKYNDRWEGIIKETKSDNGDLTSGSGERLSGRQAVMSTIYFHKRWEFLV